MKYPELKEPCKSAIEKGRCEGCQALEDPEFTGNPNCKFAKTLTVIESIAIIHKNLGIQEKIEL